MITWKRVTEARYDEMLGVVPPIYSALPPNCSDGFLVGEAADHDPATGYPRYDAFIRLGEEYFECNTPLTTMQFKDVKIFTMVVVGEVR